MNKKLSLSILSADLANIEYLITSVVASGVQRIHLDIMDGVFVPNLTIGAEICKTIERYW
jgi:ribulose-phosphate 3-epimerase